MTRAEIDAMQQAMVLTAVDAGVRYREKNGVTHSKEEALASLTGIHLGIGAAIRILKEMGLLI